MLGKKFENLEMEKLELKHTWNVNIDQALQNLLVLSPIEHTMLDKTIQTIKTIKHFERHYRLAQILCTECFSMQLTALWIACNMPSTGSTKASMGQIKWIVVRIVELWLVYNV